MSAPNPTIRNNGVIRTERGLAIAGTRITLYDVLEYLHAGWPHDAIQSWLTLTPGQMRDAVAYIDAHRDEVERECQLMLQNAAEVRRYWEEKNKHLRTMKPSGPLSPEQAALRAKLEEWKKRIASA